MKLNLICTADGFRLAQDSDYELKRRLKIGKEYEVSIKERRNPKFHRKYFALINCAWEYLTEEQQKDFNYERDVWRKCIEVAAGHYEWHYSLGSHSWLQVPKSIAFDKMTESDFGHLYERVKDVIYQEFIPAINKEEFEKQLMYF